MSYLSLSSNTVVKITSMEKMPAKYNILNKNH